VRAFLGLPVGGIRQYGPAASAVILPQLTSQNVTFDNVDGAVGAGLQVRCSVSRKSTARVVLAWR
jgi:phosphoribosylglycinamide formyltransferase 2